MFFLCITPRWYVSFVKHSLNKKLFHNLRWKNLKESVILEGTLAGLMKLKCILEEYVSKVWTVFKPQNLVQSTVVTHKKKKLSLNTYLHFQQCSLSFHIVLSRKHNSQHTAFFLFASAFQ